MSAKSGAHGSKKPRNKPYRPKPELPGGGLRALLRIEDRAIRRKTINSPYRTEDLTELGVAYWGAFAGLKTTNPSEDAWAIVCHSLNIALVLCESGLGPEHTDAIVAALDGIFRAKQRGDLDGQYRLDGAGIAAIENALQVHEAQLEHATPVEVASAYAIVLRRCEDGHVYTAAAVH
jgi:hypothetical protein